MALEKLLEQSEPKKRRKKGGTGSYGSVGKFFSGFELISNITNNI